MITVHARRDNGYMDDQSRWKPRLVFCAEQAAGGTSGTEDAQVEHVVKYRHGEYGSAAAISEVLSGDLLEAGGIRVLQRRLVSVSEGFANSYSAPGMDIAYTVNAGLHFGTVYRVDFADGPPMNRESLMDPQQLVDLWVFDTWLCNIDRSNNGNTLLEQATPSKWHIIAADQSDCFCGAGYFGSGDWVRHFLGKGLVPAANAALTTETVFADPACLDVALAKLRRGFSGISAAIRNVPNEWWRESRVNPGDVERLLDERYQKVPNLFAHYRGSGLKDLLAGGFHVL